MTRRHWILTALATITLTALPAHGGPVTWNEGYFPKDTWSERVDDFVAGWYSTHLRAMSEPSLKDAVGGDATVYRFLWLRTWGQPIAVRIERRGETRTLTAVRLDGAGGYDPGAEVERVSRALTEAEWQAAVSAIDAASFATLPTSADTGLDGAQWVLEGVVGGRYRLVDRWSPTPDGPHAAFRAACTQLLTLSGIDPGRG